MKVLLICAWLIALIESFLIVKVFKIGPIIYTISAERGWGIHSGDFLCFIPLAMALMVSLVVVKQRNA